MTERENLLRTVHFEKPDYIPATYHINSSCWDHYPQDRLQDLMEAHPILFPDFEREPEPVTVDHPSWVRAGEPYTDPWGCVWKTAYSGIMGAVIKHPLESWNALETYTPPDPDKTTHWGPIDWGTEAVNVGPAISQTALSNGEIGHGHTWLRLIDIRGYQNVLFDMADGEPRLWKLIEMLDEFNLGLVNNYLTYGKTEWMGYAEDLGMQQGPMLSPEQFRTYIKPSYRRIMKPAIEADNIIHVHADGDLRLLTEDLIEIGVQVINLQDLVNGTAWIEENLKGKICIDLDIDRQNITVHGTPERIDELIQDEVRRLGSREGGLMLIYGLYPGTPLENAWAVADAMEKYYTYYN